MASGIPSLPCCPDIGVKEVDDGENSDGEVDAGVDSYLVRKDTWAIGVSQLSWISVEIRRRDKRE